jgi:hypothetical protein
MGIYRQPSGINTHLFYLESAIILAAACRHSSMRVEGVGLPRDYIPHECTSNQSAIK